MNADQSPLQGFSAPCTRAGFAQWSFAAMGELLERRQLSGYLLGKAVKSRIPPQDHSWLCVFRPTPFLFKWRLGRLFSWLALLPSPNPSAGMFGVLRGKREVLPVPGREVRFSPCPGAAMVPCLPKLLFWDHPKAFATSCS